MIHLCICIELKTYTLFFLLHIYIYISLLLMQKPLEYLNSTKSQSGAEKGKSTI